MTTITNFVQSNVAPFSFSPTLDGQNYSATVTGNVFGNRLYLNLNALDGTFIMSRPLVGSPTGLALQGLSWANGQAMATVVAPHGYKIGTVIGLTITGAMPTAYNGLIAALITGPSTFTYPISADPGPGSVFGTASYNVNLIGGIPDANGTPFSSTLVYRAQSRQFEVSP